jgi:acyl-CoA reductase-like NAD-dependent aldehyde dehydrogenase
MNMNETLLLIGGEWVPAAPGSNDVRFFQRVNPVTGKPVTRAAAAGVHDEPQMPFGGVKASGYGRFDGKAAVEEFTTLHWIRVQTGARYYPF